MIHFQINLQSFLALVGFLMILWSGFNGPGLKYLNPAWMGVALMIVAGMLL